MVLDVGRIAHPEKVMATGGAVPCTAAERNCAAHSPGEGGGDGPGGSGRSNDCSFWAVSHMMYGWLIGVVSREVPAGVGQAFDTTHQGSAGGVSSSGGSLGRSDE